MNGDATSGNGGGGITIEGGRVGAPNPGLELLLERLWRQEVTHEHVLAELLTHTDLARVLDYRELLENRAD